MIAFCEATTTSGILGNLGPDGRKTIGNLGGFSSSVFSVIVINVKSYKLERDKKSSNKLIKNRHVLGSLVCKE